MAEEVGQGEQERPLRKRPGLGEDGSCSATASSSFGPPAAAAERAMEEAEPDPEGKRLF